MISVTHLNDVGLSLEIEATHFVVTCVMTYCKTEQAGVWLNKTHKCLLFVKCSVH